MKRILMMTLLTSFSLLSSPTYLAQAEQNKERRPSRDETLKDDVSSTAFTYQGQLKDQSGPVNGSFDFQFVLYSAQTGGDALGASEIKDTVLTNGMFSLKLDFGRLPAQAGAAVEAKESWLEIGVRPSGSIEAYTVLFPRQKLTPTPYAIFAQHEQWSLIGVPVGFADHTDRGAILTEKTTDQKPEHGAEELSQQDTPAQAGGGWTDDGAVVRLTTSSDNVGIGTSSPATKLDVRGSLTLEAGGSPGLFTGTGSSELNRYLTLLNSPNSPSASGLKAGGVLVSDNYFFADPGKNDLIVKGTVGIGTTTPKHRLSISGGPAWTSVLWGGALEITNGAAIGWQTNSAGQRFGIGHTNGGFYIFRTLSDPGTTATQPFYDVVINDDGNVGIGTTTPGFKLDVAGFIRAANVVPPSDARLKANVTTLTHVLESLEQIRGVAFQWNEQAAPLGHTPGQRDIGVIAQEVEAVFPELVNTSSTDGYKGVDYSRLTAVLIEAVKELKASNEAKAREIQMLQERLAALEQVVKEQRR